MGVCTFAKSQIAASILVAQDLSDLSVTESYLAGRARPERFMEDVRLIVDIVIALGAATIGGLIAQRLGLPALIGYILAGLAIGPNTPGLVADVDRVQLLANLGVALLMFGLGVGCSISEMIRVRRAALLGGAIQIPLTVVLGTAAGLAGGWTLGSALLLGGAFAISSSIVALKVLLGRGEMESPHARVAIGLGIVQDFSLAPMLALIPVIAGQRGGGFGIAESLLISALVLIVAFLLGTRLVPPLLRVVARAGSRELFMLTVVAIALGVALATHAVGLSLGLGPSWQGSLSPSRTSKSKCSPTPFRSGISSRRCSSSPSAC